MNDRRTDEELFNSARDENCISCFEILYLRYWKQLYREAYKRIRDKEEAEDCLQDVFTSIWNNKDKIVINETFRQYLYKVLFNRVITFTRRKLTLEAFLAGYEAEGFTNPDISISQEEEVVLLRREISRMPVQMKTAIMLSKIEGKTAEEIAVIMGITIQSVRNHIYLGMSRLKKNLKKTR